jgi:hypothetical protein
MLDEPDYRVTLTIDNGGSTPNFGTSNAWE